MHWNPDIYVPPRPWTHTADWKPPTNIKTVSGPVIAKSEVWDFLREVPKWMLRYVMSFTRGSLFHQHNLHEDK